MTDANELEFIATLNGQSVCNGFKQIAGIVKQYVVHLIKQTTKNFHGEFIKIF